MDRRNLSLRAAAKEIGVSHTTLARLLAGKRASTSTLVKLRKVHGLASLKPEDVNGKLTA